MCGKFNLNSKEFFTMDDFLEIMEKLRSKDGCQWDREQTHQSIRREFLEETYEAVEAIDTQNNELLQEELGDVLLQVVFHSQIAKEQGDFTFANVVNDICRKLIVRHPHVFGDVKVNNTEDILSNWDKIKIQTKGQKDLKENIASISTALPALMRHQKFVKKAKKYNMIELGNVANINLDVKTATENDIATALAKVVEIAHLADIDAEQVLSQFTKNSINDI